MVMMQSTLCALFLFVSWSFEAFTEQIERNDCVNILFVIGNWCHLLYENVILLFYGELLYDLDMGLFDQLFQKQILHYVALLFRIHIYFIRVRLCLKLIKNEYDIQTHSLLFSEFYTGSSRQMLHQFSNLICDMHV